MIKEVLNEREFELVNIVGARLASNQRDLSKQLNLSLGMTNMLLKRLVTKGYIRINQLNQRKVQYLLTPKGLAEKMRKSVKYTLKTIHSISLIKSRLNNILTTLYRQGHREFFVLGTSDLAFLIDAVVREAHFDDCRIIHGDQYPDQGSNVMVLICREEELGQEAYQGMKINLLQELSKEQV